MREYAIGCDIATGLGGSYSSNSALHVVDLLTREQVLEWASNTTEPADFADFAIAVANWFHGAYLAWEHNGPGAAFTRRVLDKGYKHIFHRTVMWKRNRKKNKEIGWWTDDRTKEAMFSDMRMSVLQNELILRSKTLKEECMQYVRMNKKIEHVLAASTQDGSSQGAQHGDRVIAMGVALQAMKDRPLKPIQEKDTSSKEPPMNTMAWRQRQYEHEQRANKSKWDARNTSDFTH